MLQAKWDYVEGVIARHGSLDDHTVGDWTERFYHQAPDKWRLEQSTDLTYVSDGREAVVMTEGRVLHRGRPRIPVDFVTEKLLYPGRAPLWTWRGDEGWSLVLADSRRTSSGTTIPIADRGDPVGELHVVLPSGHLDYLRLGDDVSRITDLQKRPSHPSAFDVESRQ
ncbi:MAG: hypothetical protein ABI047_16695 [Jatrophihabitantaceae bacterium]